LLLKGSGSVSGSSGMTIDRTRLVYYGTLVFVAILGVLLSWVLGLCFSQAMLVDKAAAPPVLGKEYTIVNSSQMIPRKSPKAIVSVMEFFSYNCNACHEIESTVRTWLKLQPNFVRFEQIPVSDGSSASDTITRLHYLGHQLIPEMTTRLFQWLEEGQDVQNVEVVKENFLKLGILSTDYERVYNCQSGLDSQIARGKSLDKLYAIEDIPTFIIGGRYKTNLMMTDNDLLRFFEVMNALIQRVKQGDSEE
jgi:protein-disulfide isomerase